MIALLTLQLNNIRHREVDLTGYTGHGKTALGTVPQEGRTVAVSPDMMNWLGKRVYIEGLGVFKVEDLTSRRLTNTIDLYKSSHSKALKVGRVKNRKVTMIYD